MRAVDSGTLHSERETMIVDVLARIERLFARLPMLIGFTVQDCATLGAESHCARLNAELCIADVAVHSWPGFEETHPVCAEIARGMLELLEEHPAARELLRGYTFARAFH
jgi:hypothetical protein